MNDCHVELGCADQTHNFHMLDDDKKLQIAKHPSNQYAKNTFCKGKPIYMLYTITLFIVNKDYWSMFYKKILTFLLENLVTLYFDDPF